MPNTTAASIIWKYNVMEFLTPISVLVYQCTQTNVYIIILTDLGDIWVKPNKTIVLAPDLWQISIVQKLV